MVFIWLPQCYTHDPHLCIPQPEKKLDIHPKWLKSELHKTGFPGTTASPGDSGTAFRFDPGHHSGEGASIFKAAQTVAPPEDVGEICTRFREARQQHSRPNTGKWAWRTVCAGMIEGERERETRRPLQMLIGGEKEKKKKNQKNNMIGFHTNKRHEKGKKQTGCICVGWGGKIFNKE